MVPDDGRHGDRWRALTEAQPDDVRETATEDDAVRDVSAQGGVRLERTPSRSLGGAPGAPVDRVPRGGSPNVLSTAELTGWHWKAGLATPAAAVAAA
jgi:hypothetical protein